MENEEKKESKGNKSLPLIVIVIAVLVLGAGAYMFLGKDKGTVPTDTVTVQQEDGGTTVGESFVGTLKEAIALGVGMECTYMFEGNEYQGVIKGENYKGEMLSADGKLVSVIVKDNCMWTWEQGSAQGMTFCTEEVAMEGEDEVNGGSSIWDQPESASSPGANYNCSPATISDSQFTPPADVEFLDPTSMMGEFGL
jgi:hypothetical protein